MEEGFEIMFYDLTDDAQEAFLKFMGVTDPKETNWDTFPITIVYKSDTMEA